MRRLFEGGAYSSNYCNWQLKSLLHLGQIVITFRTLLHLGQNFITFRTLLHLGQNVITFRTLLHLGPFITFRPSTNVTDRIVANFYQRRTNDLLKRSSKTNYERTTGELTI